MRSAGGHTARYEFNGNADDTAGAASISVSLALFVLSLSLARQHAPYERTCDVLCGASLMVRRAGKRHGIVSGATLTADHNGVVDRCLGMLHSPSDCITVTRY